MASAMTGVRPRDDAQFVLRSPADGYTIFAVTISTHAINVALRPELSYHPVKDFAPVTLAGRITEN